MVSAISLDHQVYKIFTHTYRDLHKLSNIPPVLTTRLLLLVQVNQESLQHLDQEMKHLSEAFQQQVSVVQLLYIKNHNYSCVEQQNDIND